MFCRPFVFMFSNNPSRVQRQKDITDNVWCLVSFNIGDPKVVVRLPHALKNILPTQDLVKASTSRSNKSYQGLVSLIVNVLINAWFTPTARNVLRNKSVIYSCLIKWDIQVYIITLVLLLKKTSDTIYLLFNFFKVIKIKYRGKSILYMLWSAFWERKKNLRCLLVYISILWMLIT